jgi:3-oxoacyl-[acyl-carrier-protein] synthase-3
MVPAGQLSFLAAFTMQVGLETVVSYFPGQIVKREDLSYLDPVVPAGMEELLRGADESRKLKDENAAEILAEGVVRKVLEHANPGLPEIDFIIATNLGGKFILPMVGTYIHHKLGFPEQTPVVNIQTCCASFVDGLNLAWNLILGGRYQRILVVAVTAICTGKYGVDETSPLARNFGDGAGAAIVSAQNLKCEFLSYSSRIFGEMYDHQYVNVRPVQHPELMEQAGVKDEVGAFVYADDWFFDWVKKKGKTFAVKGIEQSLKKAGLGLADVDMVAIHHPQESIHEAWIQGGVEAGIPREKWKEFYHRIANCGNVDVAAILAELSEQGRIPIGSVIALFPPGLGGHTPCMIIRWLA